VLAVNRKNQKTRKGRTAVMPRASVSFPPELYKNLEELARKKKVSIAWVVREAAEQYVSAEWPLFSDLAREGK
jgi:predicted transcriptional regulator